MSSFLMNSGGSYDPKFLSGSESDYSQSGYIQHTGDYYGHQNPVQYQYQASQSPASLSYGSRDPAAVMHGYGGYYQQCGITPHQQAMQMAAGHLASNSLNASTPSMTPLSRSPGSSPIPSSHPQQSHLGYSSPTQSQNTPPQQQQMTPGNNDGGMSSDCSDEETSNGNSGHMPVVYPWMKKIHVAGAGKNFDKYAIIALKKVASVEKMNLLILQEQSGHLRTIPALGSITVIKNIRLYHRFSF